MAEIEVPAVNVTVLDPQKVAGRTQQLREAAQQLRAGATGALAGVLPGDGRARAELLDVAAVEALTGSDPRAVGVTGRPLWANVARLRAEVKRWALRPAPAAELELAVEVPDTITAGPGEGDEDDLARVDDQGTIWVGERGPGPAFLIRWREAGPIQHAEPLVTLRISDLAAVLDPHDPTTARILWRPLAQRRYFDRPVEVFDGVVVVAGEFPTTGGSLRRPRLFTEAPRELVLDLREVSPLFAELALAKHAEAVEIIGAAALPVDGLGPVCRS